MYYNYIISAYKFGFKKLVNKYIMYNLIKKTHNIIVL